MTTRRLLIGTYTRRTSKGIYHASFDDTSGMFTLGDLAAEAENPTFLVQRGNSIYAVNESPSGRVSAFALRDGALEPVNSAPSGGAHPCHLAASVNWLAVANYTSGSVATLQLTAQGAIGNRVDFVQHEGAGASGLHTKRQDGPHAHQTYLAANGDLIVPDLGNDRLYRYRLDACGAFEGVPAVTQLAAGVGPRHVDLHPRLPVAYVINELGNTIDVLTWDADDPMCIQTVSTVPADFDGATYTAEIVVASDGCFVYGSNRGLDTIVSFAVDDTGRLSQPEHVPTLGAHPRHFAIDPSGRWLMIANQDSDNVVVYALGEGRPRDVVCNTYAPTPVCLHFLDE